MKNRKGIKWPSLKQKDSANSKIQFHSDFKTFFKPFFFQKYKTCHSNKNKGNEEEQYS